MTTYRVTLKLTDQPEREVALIHADTAEEAASLVVKRWPFLPPAFVWIDGTALAALRIDKTPKPSATKGQTLWRERVKRQRLAERWRQHWIDKDNRRRQG